MSQPTLPRLLLLLLLLLLHLLLIIPSAISAQPLTQHKSALSSLSELVEREDESPISIDGLCGSHSTNNTTCLHSPFGDSCSKWGFCGSFYEKEYSGIGCQADFGVCNSEFFAKPTDDDEEGGRVESATSSATSSSTSTPGIIIIPITTTFVSVVVSTSTSGSGSFTPIQTLTGMVGFCGVAGSNCAM